MDGLDVFIPERSIEEISILGRLNFGRLGTLFFIKIVMSLSLSTTKVFNVVYDQLTVMFKSSR